jgi:hypothetical protein
MTLVRSPSKPLSSMYAILIPGIGAAVTEYNSSNAAALQRLCHGTGGKFEYAKDGMTDISSAFKRIVDASY